VSITRGPAHGQAVVQPDDKVGYTPADGFNGTDGFEYQVTDVDNESSTGWVKITIGGANKVPSAVDDEVTSRAGRVTPIDVASNDDPGDGAKEVRFADPSGAPMDALDITTASGGSARRNGTKVSYTAPAGAFTGADSFSYVLVDNNGDVSKPATVHANVVRNQSPQVKDGYFSVPQNRKAVGSIAKLGWDPEKDPVTFELRSTPAGQLTLKPDGSFLYQAPAGVQVDAFSFVANDGNSDSPEGHLSIKISDADPASSPDSTTTTSASTTTTGPSSGSSSGSSSSGGHWSSPEPYSPSSSSNSGSSSSSTPPSTSKSGKSKKQPSSNNRGKSASSTKSKSKSK